MFFSTWSENKILNVCPKVMSQTSGAGSRRWESISYEKGYGIQYIIVDISKLSEYIET